MIASAYVQIGNVGVGSIIAGLMTGGKDHLKDCNHLVFSDLYVRVGDGLETFLDQRTLYNQSLFYIGLTENQIEKTWLEAIIDEKLMTSFSSGQPEMPGGADLPSEINADLVEPLPRKPSLNLLIITGDNDEEQKLGCPANVVQEWAMHPSQGHRFKKWLDTFVDKYILLAS